MEIAEVCAQAVCESVFQFDEVAPEILPEELADGFIQHVRTRARIVLWAARTRERRRAKRSEVRGGGRRNWQGQASLPGTRRSSEQVRFSRGPTRGDAPVVIVQFIPQAQLLRDVVLTRPVCVGNHAFGFGRAGRCASSRNCSTDPAVKQLAY